MHAIDLTELELVEESTLQSGVVPAGGGLCGFVCGGALCGFGCGYM
jgi:hypothetical protein